MCEFKQVNHLFQNDCILNTKTLTNLAKSIKPKWPEGQLLQTIHRDKFIFNSDQICEINMNTPKSKHFIDD